MEITKKTANHYGLQSFLMVGDTRFELVTSGM
jgi:hypothetical protein